jgi:hypothetical protein
MASRPLCYGTDPPIPPSAKSLSEPTESGLPRRWDEKARERRQQGSERLPWPTADRASDVSRQDWKDMAASSAHTKKSFIEGVGGHGDKQCASQVTLPSTWSTASRA